MNLAKAFFYKYNILNFKAIFPSSEKWSYFSEFAHWQQTFGPAAEYNDFYNSSPDYHQRYNLYDFIFNNENLDKEFDYLEFGVAAGDAMKWWSEKNQHPETQFFGFDTFTGLPEQWLDKEKTTFSQEGIPPDWGDRRCTFYPGLFQDTLSGFLKNYHSTNRKIIHLDADLYSSTKYVLEEIRPFLKRGDLIIFDEFHVLLHEFKAWIDFVKKYSIQYNLLGAINNYMQICIIIK